MKLLLKSAVAISCTFAQSAGLPPRFHPIGDTKIPYVFEAVPIWSGGALVAIEHNRTALPVVRIFDEEGRQAAVTSVNIPGADYVEVRRAAHGTGGMIAICGSAQDSAGHRTGFLALASADGKIQSLIRTEPYVPTAVAVSQDGTIWTKGAEFVPIQRTPSKTDSGIIRHFDASGNLLGAFLPQSSLSRRELFLGIDQLAANSTRAGWYMGRGASTYFEVVHDRLERYPVVDTEAIEGPESISGLTITDDDRVFVTKSANGNNPELFTLNRESRSWAPVVLPADGLPATTNWLLGGSGKTLVFKTTEQSGWLRRFEILAR